MLSTDAETSTYRLPRIKVSDNGRFLVTEAGDPFFWLGDTAWELFHRLTREEAELYFSNRQARRFTVIQAVALAELDGLNTPNRYGHRPFFDNDPARPNPDYFAYIDELIARAAAHDLYVGLLPTWGDKVSQEWGIGPIVFNSEETARAYGRWIGARYRDWTNIIWINGGDRPAQREGRGDWRAIWRALAAGLREGTGDNCLISYHPSGGEGSSAWFHADDWLDVNMMQSGHGSGHDTPVWERITHDYRLTPAKPTLDGEPNYEDHPVSPWPTWNPANGYFRDDDVRRQVYRSVFAGGCGVTYGHHFIWQMWDSGRQVQNNGDELLRWHEAINRPGAAQMRHLRALMESRPYLSRIPDQDLLVSEAGQGRAHVRATRDVNGAYALVYLPTPRPVTVKLDLLSGDTIRARWYDPRSGESWQIGAYPASGARNFTPPAEGPDWVLVLDDVAQHFGAPGA